MLVATLESGAEYLLEVAGYEVSTGAFDVSAENFMTTPLPVGADAFQGQIADADDIVTYRMNDPDGGDVRLVVTPHDGPVGEFDPVVIVRDQGIGAVRRATTAAAGRPRLSSPCCPPTPSSWSTCSASRARPATSW